MLGRNLGGLLKASKIVYGLLTAAVTNTTNLVAERNTSLFSYSSGGAKSTVGSSGGSRGEGVPCLFLL